MVRYRVGLLVPLPRVFIAFLFNPIAPAIFREVALLFSPSALSPFGCEPFLEIFPELFSLFCQMLRKKTISIVFPLPESPKPDFFRFFWALCPASSAVLLSEKTLCICF